MDTKDYNAVYVYIRGIFGGGFNLANHIYIAKLNVRHLGCRHGFLSMQYLKSPIKMFANCIFRAIRQIRLTNNSMYMVIHTLCFD